MNTVRAFGKLIDPADYRRGFGFLGWCVWLINHIRMRLERWIVLAILRLEARRSGVNKEKEKQLINAAKSDPQLEPWAKPSPNREPKLLDRLPNRRFSNSEERSEVRYSEGRKSGTRPKRPEESQDMAHTLSRSMRKKDRSMRYLPGRQHLVVSEEFEPIKDPKNERSN